MQHRFHKMHGLGNDFVIIDAREEAVDMPPARARAIADRKTGIGFDQLILIEASKTADMKMRTFNADGSEVEICGNATRALAILLGAPASLETLGGIIHIAATAGEASIDMGKPRFAWDVIPLSYAMDTAPMPVAWEELEAPHAVNVGNPHIIFFVADVDAVALDQLGPVIEHDPLFPNRINVSIAQVLAADHLKLRVWERGAGLTQACGTGACATAVAAIRAGLVTSPVRVSLPGGDLSIAWAPGENITMAGPATHVFSGETDWSRFG